MSKQVQQLKRIRRYGENFKRSLVKQYESGEYTVLELSRLYGISLQSIYRWIHAFSHYEQKGIIVIEKSASSLEKLKQQAARIKELERVVGQKQMELEYLEKLIELAGTELGIDLKKNFNTKPSDGFENISTS
jgi:transposase